MGIVNWAQWSPTICTIVAVIFGGGLTAGRIRDQEKTLARHDEQLGTHADRLGEHDIAIAESKAWREGYKAGREKP